MAHLVKKAFQITPNQLLYQQKRYRGKINIQKPRPPHYARALLDAFLTPYFVDPNKEKRLIDLCTNVEIKKKVAREPAPYTKIIARDVRKWLDNSKMICCLHRNSIREDEQFDLQIAIKKYEMHYKVYSREIIDIAIKDSPYIGIQPLLCTHFAFIFSPEPKLTELLKILRKFPQVCLMAGILEKTVLNYDDFLKYGKIDITMARVGLVQVLQNAGGVNLQRQLTHHQSTLLSRLKQIGTNETTCNENEPSVPV